MEPAHKIATEAELRALAGGPGFIVDPFNRRWHYATCAWVARMTLGAPKWYAPSEAALHTYLRTRLTQYPKAKPITACRLCGGEVGSITGAVKPPSPARAASASARLPHQQARVEKSDDCFRVWAAEYVRNGSKAASSAGELRRLITSGIHALPEPGHRILHASYAGQRSAGTDVENLLFNNIDQEPSAFRAAGRNGIRFEDLGITVPPASDGTVHTSFYEYRLVAQGDPFAASMPERLVCKTPEAIVPDGPARPAARIWLAVRRTRPPAIGPLHESGAYMLRVAVWRLDPAKCIKALIDGVTAAMQRDDPVRVQTAIARLSEMLGADPDLLLQLATDEDAPLGSKSRSSASSYGPMFTLDGATQVRVTPDDHRCVAAEVVYRGDDGPPRLAVEVYTAVPT